jgi:hypothetical protein
MDRIQGSTHAMYNFFARRRRSKVESESVSEHGRRRSKVESESGQGQRPGPLTDSLSTVANRATVRNQNNLSIALSKKLHSSQNTS